jgi:tetratricopeptide (TPR) repeat protein
VELDPDFTRPMTLLVGSYALEAFADKDPEIIRNAETVLESLRAKAPDSADFLIAQTYYTYYILRDYALALQIADQALEIVPSDTQLIAITSWIKRRQGDYAGYVEAMRLAKRLEPGNATWARNIVGQLMVLHEYDAALAEIEAFKGREYGIETYRAILALRAHGDLKRYASDVQSLAEEMGTRISPWDIWQSHFNARNFEEAERALEEIPERRRHRPGAGIPSKQALTIETFWAIGDADRLAEEVADARRYLDQAGATDEPDTMRVAISRALLAAVEENAEEAERQVRIWFRLSKQDLAERAFFWDLACEALGMAGAAEAAVRCIRDGLVEPSTIFPFLEPHLPYYDPIRAEPVFIELVEELANSSRT